MNKCGFFEEAAVTLVFDDKDMPMAGIGLLKMLLGEQGENAYLPVCVFLRL